MKRPPSRQTQRRNPRQRSELSREELEAEMNRPSFAIDPLESAFRFSRALQLLLDRLAPGH